MTFLDFPSYSGYSIQVSWANVQATDVKFSQDLTHKKSLKSYIKCIKQDQHQRRTAYISCSCGIAVSVWSPGRILVGVVILVYVGVRLDIIHAIGVTVALNCRSSSCKKSTTNQLSNWLQQKDRINLLVIMCDKFSRKKVALTLSLSIPLRFYTLQLLV